MLKTNRQTKPFPKLQKAASIRETICAIETSKDTPKLIRIKEWTGARIKNIPSYYDSHRSETMPHHQLLDPQ